MFKRMIITLLAAAIVTAVGPAAARAEAPLMTFETHEIEFSLDVANHSAAFVDRGTARIASGWNVFQIGAAIQIESFTINGKPVEFTVAEVADSASLPAEARPAPDDIDTTGNTQLIVFQAAEGGQVSFEIVYSGTFSQDVSNIRFSNEKVGGEVTATISEQGAYLSPSAYYYPCGAEEMAAYKLSAIIPEQWESISDGNRLDSDLVSGRKLQIWENPYQSDGVTFFASTFQVGQMPAGDVWVFCYFFPEDSQLINGYLRASVNYIQMYEELIGAYPYKRFTVVDNFFPTGYGMPGWTLLGQQVLRLPFIVGTSLGHEVLHNWWGNSVFVDYESGNWCEGLTVYGADYRYKAMKSADEARDYRKNILKQYVSYVNEGNDFPLREFTSRSDPSTRTIGYNKSMMIFHMIEDLVGTEAFFSAWKNIYSEFKGRTVSWEDWIAAYEKTSGMDLSFIIPEWIERPGAPVLAVTVLEETAVPEKEERMAKIKLSETSGQGYHLNVPVRVSGPGYEMNTSITLEQPETEFTFTFSETATTLDIDPDYHLFRQLYPEEVEPVISAILGNPNKQFVCPQTDSGAAAAFGEFGLNMIGDTVKPVVQADAGSAPGIFGVLLTDSKLPDYLAKLVSLTADSVIVAGVSYGRQGHTFVLTGQDWNGFEKYMVVLSTDYASLPRVGQLLPHYGKYSYLVFEGPKNVGKGQWEPESSPLKIRLAASATEGGK